LDKKIPQHNNDVIPDSKTGYYELMSPKIDFVFKRLFGDDKNKDILMAFLSAVLKIPKPEFTGIKIINSELLREFKEDKKGILDVRVQTEKEEQINIEIQILPTEYMPERTLFYLSKMYTSQINPGDTYDKLKKCITINIVDFHCTPQKKPYACYHFTDNESGYQLTDILQVHFLELPKLLDEETEKNEDDPIIQWMIFLDSKSKGVLEMLSEKNTDIKKAYSLLQIISQDQKARLAYEARQAEISDQLTRIKTAAKKGKEEGKAEGKAEGIIEGKVETAKEAIKEGAKLEFVAKITGIPLEELKKLEKEVKEKMI
jgi:predicted transposase/invertase (TIGR01784 family)